jgi:hypothetical protein
LAGALVFCFGLALGVTFLAGAFFTFFKGFAFDFALLFALRFGFFFRLCHNKKF